MTTLMRFAVTRGDAAELPGRSRRLARNCAVRAKSFEDPSRHCEAIGHHTQPKQRARARQTE